MADRFWISNSGNINDTAHLSLTSGGASGASALTSAINAYFDASSFTLGGQTVTRNVLTNCLDMDWTGATNNPTLGGSSVINVFGSLILIAAMTFTGGNLQFHATATGKTVRTNGLNIQASVVFQGSGGGWTLLDGLSSSGAFDGLSVYQGTLDFNDQLITVGNINIGLSTNVTTLHMRGSTINNAGNFTVTVSVNLTINAGSSRITMSGNTKTFAGGGYSYYGVTLTGTPITITGSNTFNNLNLTPAKTVNLTSGTTQTVTDLSAMGTLGNLITIQSTSSGSAASISKATGVQVFNYCTIKDITATGGATFNAYNSVDGGGNIGINFLGGNPPSGYTHKIMGQLITKVNGVTPSKVNGV